MEKKQLSGTANCENQWLYRLILAIFILQPLLDVVSYWQSAIGAGNTVTLALRFALLAGTILLAFIMSDKKKIYIIAAAICAVFGALHIFACVQASGAVEYGLILSDMVNYVRVLQFPIMAICFITFLKKDERAIRAVEQGFVINFGIIALVEIVSVITNTNPYTYPSMDLGVVGWFYFPNSQSAILSMMIPVIICIAARSEKKWIFPLAVVVSFAELYFFGTRLSYVAIFAIAIGTLIVWFFTKTLQKRKAAILVVITLVCALAVQLSPMYVNQALRHGGLAQKQQNINVLVRMGTAEYGDEGYRHLKYAYEEYCGGLVDKFGLETVADYFGNSTDAEDLTYVRSIKMAYCDMLMDAAPSTSQVFGLSLDSLTFENYIYDVENDFHGIYYLFGVVGLILLLGFIGYFLLLIACALVKEAKKYFTLEAGAAGIGLCMGLIHIYNTAGVLRRPNASFYLSVILAVVYYLVKIRKYNSDVKEN